MQAPPLPTGHPPTRPLYLQPTMLVLLALGFAGGVPLEMAMNIMPTWASAAGWDVVAIGYLALARIPYTFKVLWAPVTDHCSIPGLRWLGRRRSWLVLTQLTCLAILLGLGFQMDDRGGMLAPVEAIVLLGVLVFAGATQDIVGDAYRAEVLSPREFGAGASMWVSGARIASLVAGAGVLVLAGRLASEEGTRSWAWATAISLLAASTVIGLVASLLGREPERPPGIAHGFVGAVVQPFELLVRQWGWRLATIFLFIIAYRLPDVLGGSMSSPLLVKGLGYDVETIGWVRQGLGSAMSILGTIAGGWLVARQGIGRSLWIAGIVAAASNVGYYWLAARHGATNLADATASPAVAPLAVVLCIESFCGGLATCAFVAFMMSLCDIRATATHYALLTSVMAIGNTFVGPLSGWMVKSLDYQPFLLWSIASAAPGLLLIQLLPRSPGFDRASTA